MLKQKICAAKSRSERVPAVGDYAGWDEGRKRRVGYVLAIDPDGRVHLHLLETEHGPPTDPQQLDYRQLEDVYRVCSQPPISTATHGRCRFHPGGPSGIQNGNFKHGAYSKHLPQRLVQDYLAITADTELTELRHDIDLVHTRIIDLLGRVDGGESGALWEELKEATADFQTAVRESRASAVRAAVERINDITSRGQADFDTWADILRLMETKRKLKESDARIAEKLGKQMTADRALAMLAYVETALNKSLADHLDQATADLVRASFATYMRAIYHGTNAAVIVK